MMRSTLLAASLRSAWNLLEDHGYSAERHFQESGLNPALLDKSEGRFDLSRAIKLWDTLTRLFGDPCLGLKYANYWHPSNLHALGYAWISSMTLRDGLIRLIRYSKVLHEGVVYHLTENGENATVRIEHMFNKPPAVAQLLATTSLATFLTMCQLNYGKRLNLISVTFKYDKPKCSGKLFAFFKTNVSFNTDKNSLTFPQEIMDKTLGGHNQQLAQYSDHVVNTYLLELEKTNITERARVKIIEMLTSGDVSAKNIAKQLYLSERSLSRRLNEAGTSFRDIVNATRKDLALRYLNDENVSLAEIPYLLGYSDYSAFSKAYNRWTGKSPSGRTRKQP